MTLPSTESITYTYAGTGDCDNHASRVTSVKDGSLRLSSYEYRDLATVTTTTHNELPMYSTEAGTTAGTYTNLDTFGRITSSRWVKDLSTDVDVYRVDLSYDRNSNITWAEDKIATGFDVKYDMDSLNRLTKADEGTRSGGSITSRKRQQEWTLSHTGNWNNAKLDLDGDLVYTGVREYNDTRAHNKANEITTQDTDSNSSVNYTLTHDAVGNMTDDGERYKYEYDAFGRLRYVKNQAGTTIAEYRYNGLGHRIAWNQDSDGDSDLDSNDKWYYPVYDERWRMVAVYRETDSSPKEQFVNHQAGLDGAGGASMLDAVICRYKDANTAWTAASDGTLEERRYYCHNWRNDVVALVSTAGQMVETARYTSYGIPFGMPAADTNSDGNCDTTDINQIQTWINTSTYDVRGDVDLDGDVDAADKTLATNRYQGSTLGFGVLSDSDVGNRKGYAGYERDVNFANMWHVRNRVYRSDLGRWTRRDPLGYVDGAGLFEYCNSDPKNWVDELGYLSNSYEAIVGAEADALKSLGVTQEQIDVANSEANFSVIESTFMLPAVGSARLYIRIPQLALGIDTKWLGGVDDREDAYRHCIWACRMTKALGESVARLISDHHETFDTRQTESSQHMDFHNNRVGFKCGSKKEDCFICCYNSDDPGVIVEPPKLYPLWIYAVKTKMKKYKRVRRLLATLNVPIVLGPDSYNFFGPFYVPPRGSSSVLISNESDRLDSTGALNISFTPRY